MLAGIAEMFAELNGYPEYEVELVAYAMHARRAATERAKLWRALHPARYRAHQRRYRATARGKEMRRRWTRNNRDHLLAYKRTYRAAHVERVRAWNRKHQAAARARKKGAR